jgi:Holliday junction resolvase RusA-like endonuclease
MTGIVRIEVAGAPVAKGRPRLTTRGGFARAYTPAKTQRYEDLLRLAAGLEMANRPLIEGPLFVFVEVYVPIPQSLSKRKRAEAIDGKIRPLTRPDLDNYIKVLDALNGIVWRDDAQIVMLSSSKAYAEKPRLIVTVRELEAA